MDRPHARSRPRSPLAMVVLAMLAEEPMHVYRMHQLIRDRAKDDVVNVGSRNSIHQVVERLARDGLVEPCAAEDHRGRTTYRLLPDGDATLREWLAESLRRRRQEYPELPAALSFVAMLSPVQVAEYLEQRIADLESILAGPTPEATAQAHDLHRIFVIEDEYRRAMLEAELGWVRSIVAELASGALSWSRPKSSKPVDPEATVADPGN